ncbi:MAG: hypothetical protein GY950_26400 [bacterium]|nr:hypothetical protein [bacterium]
MKIKAITKKILALAGFHAFIFTAKTSPLMIVTLILMTAILFIKLKYKKSYMHLLFPLASGLLIFPMKLFYWDGIDFLHRVNNLLLISLIFIAALVIKEFKLLKKFLLFFNRLSLKKRSLYIFILVEILFILSSWIMVEKGVEMGGDEPHYMVISHSIARDFDLNVFNQYARDEYREFIDLRLSHHARVGKGFKRWFSYGHLPGLSATLAPFFLFKIPHPFLYFLVRSFLGLFGALLAVLIYRFCLKLWRHRNLAIFITAAYTFTAPVFFFSIHVFAELQASLLILSALYLLLFAEKKNNVTTVLLAGFLLSVTVFWGLKYSIFIFVFSAGFFFYFLIKKKEPKKAFGFVLFPILLQLIFFSYLYFAYGNLDPMSIYNGVMTEAQQQAYEKNMQAIPLQKRVETLLGIFFDQRDGLLLYSPLYFFFFPGLIIAFKKFRTYFPHLLIAAAGFGFILFMGYSTVRAGYCPQGRYLVPAAWVLMLFAVIYRNETTNRFFKKLFYYLPVYSVGVVIYQVLHPFTLYQGATHQNLDRPGLMFQQWGNLHLSIPDILPSFVKVPGNFKYLPNLLFLVLFVVFIIVALKQMKNTRFRFFSPLLFVFLFAVVSLFPVIPTYNPILLTPEDGSASIPCKIYGESYYPTRAAERKFPLPGKRAHSFTVSTLKPVPLFVLDFENNGEKNCAVYISNFDRRLKGERIPARKRRKIYLENPRYRRFKNHYFYRFHLKMEPPPQSSFYVQVYPAKPHAGAPGKSHAGAPDK